MRTSKATLGSELGWGGGGGGCSTAHELHETWEGYYCPAAMGSTGMAVYFKKRIGPLGEPGAGHALHTLLKDLL